MLGAVAVAVAHADDPSAAPAERLNRAVLPHLRALLSRCPHQLHVLQVARDADPVVDAVRRRSSRSSALIPSTTMRTQRTRRALARGCLATPRASPARSSPRASVRGSKAGRTGTPSCRVPPPVVPPAPAEPPARSPPSALPRPRRQTAPLPGGRGCRHRCSGRAARALRWAIQVRPVAPTPLHRRSIWG